MATLIPENESERLAALRAYQILDTQPERAYDELTELAAQFCNCPVAVIGLVDETRAGRNRNTDCPHLSRACRAKFRSARQPFAATTFSMRPISRKTSA